MDSRTAGHFLSADLIGKQIPFCLTEPKKLELKRAYFAEMSKVFPATKKGKK